MIFPQLMAILNVTPDSFSDGGRFFKPIYAVAKARSLVVDGADILDIGAQSTRPGYVAISVSEEISRIRPVLERVSKEVEVPVSVDTYYPEVASLAADFGVKFLNATYGFTDIGMVRIARSHDLCCIINYCGHVDGMKDFFLEQVDLARKYGISEGKIYLDPGVGFGKTFLEDFNIIMNIGKCRFRDYPIVLGISRKRVVRVVSSLLAMGWSGCVDIVKGLVNVHKCYLDEDSVNFVLMSDFFEKICSLVKFFEGNIPRESLEDADDRDFITGVLNILAADNGADLLRVHNVKLSKVMLKIYKKTQ